MDMILSKTQFVVLEFGFSLPLEKRMGVDKEGGIESSWNVQLFDSDGSCKGMFTLSETKERK